MRAFILAALLLGSSGLSPCLAQEQPKPTVEAPQTKAPDQNADQPRDQRAGRDRSRADDRTMGPDWRMRRGDDERIGRDRSEPGPEGRMRRDGDRVGRDDRETGPDQGMRRDRDWDRGDRDRDRGDHDRDRGRYGGHGDRDSDHADRDKDGRSYFDEDRPRRRVKICIEYDNGDEYCRYRR